MPKSAVFCPKCKSSNVRKEITIVSAIGIPGEWECNNCGFRGHIFPEIEKLKKNNP